MKVKYENLLKLSGLITEVKWTSYSIQIKLATNDPFGKKPDYMNIHHLTAKYGVIENISNFKQGDNVCITGTLMYMKSNTWVFLKSIHFVKENSTIILPKNNTDSMVA